MYFPTSPGPSVYCEPTVVGAFGIAVQLVPALSVQSSHCIVVSLNEPDESQTPGSSVSVLPSCGVPVIDGGVWFTGGAA